MKPRKYTDAVRKHYARLATQSESTPPAPCCGPDKPAAGLPQYVALSMNETYRDADQTIVAAADLGLGCGTPVEHADIQPGMTVLDLGAGAGIDVFLAARIVGPNGRVIGLDMTDEMLQRARTNQTRLGITNAEFRKGEIEEMPVDTASIDRVISNCVLNLLADKQRAFEEIYRVLRPGGRFTVADIVYTGRMPSEVRSDPDLVACCIGGALEKEQYLGAIRRAGFQDIEILAERHYPAPPGQTYVLQSVTVKGDKR